MQFSIYHILATLAVAASALPSPDDFLNRRQVSTDPSLGLNGNITLSYSFTLDAFLASDPSRKLPFGFRSETLNEFGRLGLQSVFEVKRGKLLVNDLEVGSAALRQPVVLLPPGEGVPVRVFNDADGNLFVEVNEGGT